ncbi:MAG TPA: TIGR03619 family F420-dependent LLM class oxidoreductase [Candidatus Acidoferrales bacterium]|nr:TIGR03619 family F420-dependent LLM class oxidoreductase [Candidatus Acidoferrales bacterium]
MKFGVGLPTCTAGLMYPTPFANPTDIVRIAVEVEQLGYYDIAGNDHFSTPTYVRSEWSTPPDFFDPLITYGYCAAQTSTLKLMTGILVMPMRHPVVLAKQVATLDQFSQGRVILGLGIGAYREEFIACYPSMAALARSELLEESAEVLRGLFEQRRFTFTGKHYAVEDVEMYPKPVQVPLPIYFAGNAHASIRRAAESGQGWLPAGIGAAAIAAGRTELTRIAEFHGRDPNSIAVAAQVVVALGTTHEQALNTFETSQMYRHLVSLSGSTLRGADMKKLAETNLVGTPDEICERVSRFAAAGVTHLCGLLFVGDTVDAMLSGVREFARTVLPAFAE